MTEQRYFPVRELEGEDNATIRYLYVANFGRAFIPLKAAERGLGYGGMR